MLPISIRPAILCLALALPVSPVQAGGMKVGPILVNLGADAQTSVLTLENSGTSPSLIQLQLVEWTAPKGEDEYKPSQDIVVTPPIFTLQPGHPQIVRVGINRDPHPERELAYRLFIEEVPPPPKPGQQGLQIALRLSVPIFVQAPKASQHAVRWRATEGPGHSITLKATNDGNKHARLQAITLRATASDKVIASLQPAAYLLPGQTRKWVIPAKEALPTARLRLAAEYDGGAIDANLDVEAE
ncbi:MAG: molecular chaperone [Bacteroidota bacterium]